MVATIRAGSCATYYEIVLRMQAIKAIKKIGKPTALPLQKLRTPYQGAIPMPIYEYKCTDCGHIFEILTTSGNKETEVQCRNCQSTKVAKILSAGSFRSGSGTGLQCAAPAAGCGKKSGFS